MARRTVKSGREFRPTPGLQESVPWLLLVLALLNVGWALWVAAAPAAAVYSPAAGGIALLHELTPVHFTALQRAAGAADAEVIDAECDLYGPIYGADVPVAVRRRVATRVAGVSLVPEWRLQQRGYWVVAGPFASPGRQATARRALAAAGIAAFAPQQHFWRNLLVLGSAPELGEARRLRDGFGGDFGAINVIAAGEMDLLWWLRIMHWEGVDPGAEIGAATVYSDGSELLKKSCKSIAKPIEFD